MSCSGPIEPCLGGGNQALTQPLVRSGLHWECPEAPNAITGQHSLHTTWNQWAAVASLRSYKEGNIITSAICTNPFIGDPSSLQRHTAWPTSLHTLPCPLSQTMHLNFLFPHLSYLSPTINYAVISHLEHKDKHNHNFN